MKSRLLLAALLVTFSSAFAQDISPQKLLPAGYYVVVAAYRTGQENFAQKYVSELNTKNTDLHASYGFDESKKMYFVFLDRYGEFNTSVDEMLKVRKDAGFGGAWVRVLKTGVVEKYEVAATEKETPPAKAVKETKSVVAEQKKEAVSPAVAAASEPAEQPANNLLTDEEVGVQPKMEPVKMPHTMANTPVFLSLYNSRNNKVVAGEVQVIDVDRNALIKKVKGNDYLTLPDPKSKTGKVNLVADVFGYRKVQKELNYKDQIAQGTEAYKEMFGNFILVEFELVRIQKGDIATLYNVYFYNDAAIMQPDSQNELNGLLALMEEKPTSKIVLHGHTNGSASGKIITMGSSKDFFSINGNVKEGFGSSKELSEERAKTIKEWLVSKGVAADRIAVKAWGGGKMIHDKHSVNAKKNVRVEVELVEE